MNERLRKAIGRINHCMDHLMHACHDLRGVDRCGQREVAEKLTAAEERATRAFVVLFECRELLENKTTDM